MERRFWQFSVLAFIFIFLVIIAGSVVRMTGSGMGCPDWPKCFGHYIPPMSADELKWDSKEQYDKKQMIIVDDELFFAKKSFVSGNRYDNNNWEKYTQHDYAKFNVAHTWIEYVNRLFGALLGVFIFGMLVCSIFLWRHNKWLFILTIIQFVLVGFQAWLGKLTVDSNLQPLKITYHMIGAIALIIIHVVIFHQKEKQNKESNLVFYASLVALSFLFVQILLGTQVRQEIDILHGELPDQRDLWIERLSMVFEIHRSFSIILSCISIYLFQKLKRLGEFRLAFSLLVIVGLEVLIGIVLAYFEMPKLAQPTHLLLSMLMFTILSWICIQRLPNKVSLN